MSFIHLKPFIYRFLNGLSFHLCGFFKDVISEVKLLKGHSFTPAFPKNPGDPGPHRCHREAKIHACIHHHFRPVARVDYRSYCIHTAWTHGTFIMAYLVWNSTFELLNIFCICVCLQIILHIYIERVYLNLYTVYIYYIIYIWLVVYLPLWKIWVRQLGWLFHSQLNGKSNQIPWFQNVPNHQADRHMIDTHTVPSGKLTVCYWKWP